MLYLLCIARDGWARFDGQDGTEWARHRWAICRSADGKNPAARYRNGGPVGLTRPVSGSEPPAWMRAAVAHVRCVGGYTLAELEYVVEHYRRDRSGSAYGAMMVAK